MPVQNVIYMKETYETSRGKRTVIAYADCKGSDEPVHPGSLARTYAVAHISSRPRGAFSQRTRHVASLRGWACALKN